ncbi:phosphotransferase [Flavimobilis sp. GY10621]|uniref:Phosphotransferase n=1 Tax=Flavimobilis rhizosphaerae TaxID=2775421 RepID=A0ABR9DT27_9MICO|nr:phosphotransferase [Flavimobilis rhizosphaerae]MBD9699566.1 phosphotransferase [Flavimobilis rhizosphaerae]
MHDDSPGTELTGGNMAPVVKVGDTVRRTTGPWTPAVHALLRSYAAAGIAEAPRVLGIDGAGREVLTYLDGTMLTDLPAAQAWSRPLLVAAGSLLRRLHDASVPLVDLDLAWRAPSHPPVEVICHNDVAPYNLVVRAHRLAGIIDVDMASPGSRVWDLAYLAYRLVPWVEDADGYEPSRDGERGARLAELVASYGLDAAPDEVRRVAAARLDELAEFTDQRAAETGRTDFLAHAAMYRRDAARLRASNPRT